VSMRVLVFPGGTECGLEIWRSLRWRKEIQLFSAGAPVSNHAPYVFSRHFEVPPVSNQRWLPRLLSVIRANSIDFVFPAHDDVITELMRHRRSIPAKIVTSPFRTCIICRSKSATYRSLGNVVRVPRVYTDVSGSLPFPVFVKPDKGQGSQDTHVVTSKYILRGLLNSAKCHYIVCEYLPGEEYTVDCLTDQSGKLLYVAGRKRVRIRQGIAVDTAFTDDPELERFAIAINTRLKLRGAWFFQVKRDSDGELTLLEVAPRIAGAMALDRVRGANLPLLSLYVVMGVKVSLLLNRVNVRMDRALTNRYGHDLSFTHVYVDYDDTLIVNGKVNLDLVKFLYQCLNSHVNLTLVTRHKGNVESELRRRRLNGLFDNIQVVGPDDSKSDVIDPSGGAIFVDDSFSERKEVADTIGIATFDSSMLEMLMDDRV
jgi:carbamoyl-phosphate synthase large subunit